MSHIRLLLLITPHDKAVDAAADVTEVTTAKAIDKAFLLLSDRVAAFVLVPKG